MKKIVIKTNKTHLTTRTEKINQKLKKKELVVNRPNTSFISSLPSFNKVKDGFLTIS